jgi:hypothetical protein
MLAIQKNSTKHDEFLKMITSYNLFIFQPPYMKSTSGPTRRPEYYITTCRELDLYVQPYQTIARLKETFVANSQYRQCEITDEVQVNESGKLGTTIGPFTFF